MCAWEAFDCRGHAPSREARERPEVISNVEPTRASPPRRGVPRSPRGSPSSSRVFTRRASTNDPAPRGGNGINHAGVTHEKRCDAPRRQRANFQAVSHFRFGCLSPARRPVRRARFGCLVAPRAMAVRAVALFDRAGAVGGAARRASTLDRRSDGRLARHVGDSSAATGLNGRMAFRGRGGRARPAAGRGVDGVDDRSGNRREVREYPFGRVSRTSNPVVPSETAPSVISHAERADRGDGSRTRQYASRARWEQTGPGQWSASSYSRAYRGPAHANDVPPPPPGLPPSSGGGSRVARTARSPLRRTARRT